MSGPSTHRTTAETRRSRWPGWIWAVPVAVIAVAAWLGIRHLASGGDKATVFFDNAYGLSPGSSPVTFRGVTVGDVSEVEPTSDGRGVAVTIELKRKYGGYLRRDTRFWLVGAEVSLADLSTLKSVIAGPHIALEPGSGPSAHRFEGQDQPPAVPFPTAGSNYTLLADHLGPVGSGSPVYFEGKEVGKITSARFEGPHRFALTAFIRAPFDRLVGSQTRFWDASAVRVSASGAGLKARLVSPAALLTGSVAFEAPIAASGGAPATAPASFPLYDDERTAKDAPIGPQVPYLVRFTGPVGDLEKGAAVKMRGFRVGEVTSVELRYNAQTGRMEAPVAIELEPVRLRLAGATADSISQWREPVDALMRRLVARGVRATISQDPPLIGAKQVDLDVVPAARRARMGEIGGEEEIPSAASGDIASIQRNLGDVTAKLNAIPLGEIGENVRSITAHIRSIASSPKLTDSLEHLDSTLAEVDRTVHQAGPQVAPLIAELRRAASEADSAAAAANRLIGGSPEAQDSDLPSLIRELSWTSRSVRALADYLEEHPESLIKGKGKPKAGEGH